MSYLSELVPLLFCPLCSPPAFLVAPTTLRCGHTVCSAHVPSSVCPAPTCSTAQCQGFTPSIPFSSRVEFFAAPQSEDVSAASLAQPRLDVRINNIIQLFRHARLGERDASSYSDDESDRDDSGTPDTRSRALIPRSQPRQPAQAFSLDFPRPINSVAEFDKALTAELTCEICLMLLYQPVTTPCQHTFCSKCLQKSLDHSILCPLCRQDLPGFAYFQEHPHNKVLLSLLLKACANEYASRGEAIENAERHARLDTPIFVCQLSFPGMPTLLHFFEPRYRLMLRRCLESPSPTFGMIMPPRAAPLSGHGATAGTEFGTMHEIRSVQMLADGRSMVQTWGIYRFRILERDSLDGYMIGRVEKIDDYDDDLGEWAGEEVRTPIPSTSGVPLSILRPLPPTVLTRTTPTRSPRNVTRWSRSSPLHSSQQSQSTEALMAACHLFLSQLCEGTAPWVVQRLNHTYGPQPPDDNPGAFSFWMGMVLPVDEHEKAKLLPVKSVRLRLRMVVGWIEQLNSNWWFSRGCIVL
ncbi:LON-domain-containing protein [Pisolithus croceorrhizus]|nr:LON-domain-containing protein [Pisolithus croceorrhizus]